MASLALTSSELGMASGSLITPACASDQQLRQQQQRGVEAGGETPRRQAALRAPGTNGAPSAAMVRLDEAHPSAAVGQNGCVIPTTGTAASAFPSCPPRQVPTSSMVSGIFHGGSVQATAIAAASAALAAGVAAAGAMSPAKTRPEVAGGADGSKDTVASVESQHLNHATGSPESEAGSLAVPGPGPITAAVSNSFSYGGPSAGRPTSGIVLTGPAVPSRLLSTSSGHGAVMDLAKVKPLSIGAKRGCLLMSNEGHEAAAATAAAAGRPGPIEQPAAVCAETHCRTGQAVSGLPRKGHTAPLYLLKEIASVTLPLSAIMRCVIGKYACSHVLCCHDSNDTIEVGTRLSSMATPFIAVSLS